MLYVVTTKLIHMCIAFNHFEVMACVMSTHACVHRLTIVYAWLKV